MKFIVERTEIKKLENGMEYIAIYDKDNKDWYEELKKFNKDSLKVMYNKDTLQVSSKSKDASFLAPTAVGDVIEEIESEDVAINPSQYFVEGKLIELKPYETIKNGKIVFNKEFRIEEIKKELREMKDKKIQLGVKIKEGVYHPVRDTDKVNLMIAKNSWAGTRKWKFYDEDGNGVIDDITLEIIDKIFSDGEKVLNGAILGETEAENALDKLTDKEIKELDIKKHFESYYKKMGGI